MTLFFADLVREACQGTGIGDLALDGALPGHRAFAEVVPPGARFHYCIAGMTRPEEWETGEGELGSGGSLLRMPLSSSAAGRGGRFLAGAEDGRADRRRGLVLGPGGGRGAAEIADVEGLTEALAGKAALAGASFAGAVDGAAASRSAASRWSARGRRAGARRPEPPAGRRSTRRGITAASSRSG